MKQDDKNYPTHELELARVLHALETWRHYLYGISFKLITGYQSSKYIFTQKDLYNRKRRWLEFLKDYDIKIDYQDGNANKVVDALSHYPTQFKDYIITMMTYFMILPIVISRVRLA